MRRLMSWRILLLALLLGWPSLSLAVPTVLTSGEDLDETQTATTASITPTANRPVFAIVWEYDPAGTCLSGVSGGGLTWTQQLNVNATATSDANVQLCVWSGISASPSAGTLTLTASTASPDYLKWVIVDGDGATTGTIVQSVSAEGTGTTASVTLAAFASASNWAMTTMFYNQADTMVPEAGSTELFDGTGFGGAYHSQYRADNGDLSQSVTLGASGGWTMIAFEVSTGGGGGGATCRGAFSMMGAGGC